MADIAQVLLLPPPPPRPSGQALTPRERNALAASGDTNGANDATQARRFRFRVYEGGDSGDTNTRYDTRRTGNAGDVTRVANGGDDAPSASSNRNRTAGRAAPTVQRSTGAGASSAFLAQSIAQEQLGEGLHNPPNAQAAYAYNSTGAALRPRATAGIDITA
jgi:hypothetical protein